MTWSAFLLAVVLSVFPLLLLFRKILRWRRPGPPLPLPGQHVAFFHPYCNAGGGGERVLWMAVLALMKKYPEHRYYVYTGDAEPAAEIRQRVYDRFQLRVPESLQLVRLRSRRLLEASNYPALTLVGQSLGSVVVGLEALLRLLPDVYIDTMGYAFTLPVFRLLGGCRVAAYVHYPTVSSDMLETVASGQQTFNNSALIARFPPLRRLKVVYYQLFAFAYRLVGAAADLVMVNGSWTRNHIVAIWRCPQRTRVVFPPVDTARMREVEKEAGERKPWLISVAQFRPEKDHALQLHAFALLLKQHPSLRPEARLVLAGGCRDSSDHGRVAALQALAKELDISERVDLEVNVPLDRLLQLYGAATVGLHTMKNEHFGIGVVEMMVAGLVVVAHRSGGPLADIVDTAPDTRTGYLACSAQEYADAAWEALALEPQQRRALTDRARSWCDRFSELAFEQAFLDSCQLLLDPAVARTRPRPRQD